MDRILACERGNWKGIQTVTDHTRHTYVIKTDPSTTPEYKIGYQHGAQGKPGLQTTAMGLQENYIAGYAAGYQEKRDKMTEANERTMITLRLKKDPSVVLPEMVDLIYTFKGWSSFFSELDWEPVPPPYTLPDGIGAVLRDKDGGHFVRVGMNQWRRGSGRYAFTDADMIADRVERQWVTLSEGVNVDD